MDGPCVKCFDCTLCSMIGMVRCVLRQSVVPCYSIGPKYKTESENPSLRSLLPFQVFTTLSSRNSACVASIWTLPASTHYLVSWNGEKNIRLVTKLTINLPVESRASWHTEPWSPKLRVPPCPLPRFYVLDCITLKRNTSLQLSLAPKLAKRRHLSWVAQCHR